MYRSGMPLLQQFLFQFQQLVLSELPRLGQHLAQVRSAGLACWLAFLLSCPFFCGAFVALVTFAGAKLCVLRPFGLPGFHHRLSVDAQISRFNL